MTNDVKTKIKKIFIAIGTGILSIGSFILGILLHNNRESDDRIEGIQDNISNSVDGIQQSLDQLRRNTESIRKTNEQLDRTNQRFNDTNGNFESTNQRFSDLLDEIEKTKHDK